MARNVSLDPGPDQKGVQHVPHVVIVGAGFGGINAAQSLRNKPVRVTIIDRRNHHLFQPLLYQVATSGLSASDIASPIRHILSRQTNAEILMAEVTGIDPEKHVVYMTDMLMQDKFTLSYDYLILATGAQENYFGHNEWKERAPGLKSIEDAIEIRHRVLLAFESAELEIDPVRRRALLTFVLVGGGPTGVELAGAIAELSRRTLARDFRHIDPKDARIILVEGEPRILSTFPERLSKKAAKELKRLGVEVRTHSRVEDVGNGCVVIGGQYLMTETVIWTAGVRGSDAGKWLQSETDRTGRVLVMPDLTVSGHPNVFVIGDTSRIKDLESPLPGVAQVAIQGGRYVARVITQRVNGQLAPGPFAYFDKGSLATVGRAFGIVDIGPLHMSGFLAWILWLVVHIFFLIGFQNRFLVLFQWAWAYLTFQRGARIITLQDLMIVGSGEAEKKEMSQHPSGQ